MSMQMAVIRSSNVKAELAALAEDADDEERRQQREYEEEQRELLNLEYELDDYYDYYDYYDDEESKHDQEKWERHQACVFIREYHPNLDEDAACKMYAEFQVFINAGHSFVDALAFSGMQPSDNPAVNYVRRFEPFCSEKDAVEKYRIYRSYRDEGQSEIISRQYAGLL